MPEARRSRRLTLAAAAVLFVAAIGVAVAARNLRHSVTSLSVKVDQLQQGQTPASVSARQARARLQFTVCAKSPASIDGVKLADFEKACQGYDTLAHAYRSEGVPAP